MLTEIKIAGPAISDSVLSEIAELPQLSSLTVEDAGITAEGVQNLAKHEAFALRLKTLTLSRCYGVTDDALNSLSNYPNLKKLSLKTLMVTGEFLQNANPPLSVQSLVITNGFLGDESIANLVESVPRLKHLDLRGNAGITNVDSVTQQFPDLEKFYFDEE